LARCVSPGSPGAYAGQNALRPPFFGRNSIGPIRRGQRQAADVFWSIAPWARASIIRSFPSVFAPVIRWSQAARGTRLQRAGEGLRLYQVARCRSPDVGRAKSARGIWRTPSPQPRSRRGMHVDYGSGRWTRVPAGPTGTDEMVRVVRTNGAPGGGRGQSRRVPPGASGPPMLYLGPLGGEFHSPLRGPHRLTSRCRPSC
jgi:hypothetical protein